MQYEGEQFGPLFFVFAALHGNEHAGVEALKLVHKMLEVEPITNPIFEFKGKVVGLIGNISAVEKGVRYIDEDLNRMWENENVQHIMAKSNPSCNSEEKELKSLIDTINNEIEKYKPEEIYVLDLHTTSSHGGIFAIPNTDSRSLELAQNLHTPVILNMLSGISGTTLHYFNSSLPIEASTTSVTFEAGQHNDKLSVNRCIAAVVNCLRSIGCVKDTDVENIHDQLLISYSKNLPRLSKLIYKHEIEPEDGFVMESGFENFDAVKKGRILGHDHSGHVRASADGLLLMPLYQKKGNEGFFIIQPIKH